MSSATAGEPAKALEARPEQVEGGEILRGAGQDQARRDDVAVLLAHDQGLADRRQERRTGQRAQFDLFRHSVATEENDPAVPAGEEIGFADHPAVVRWLVNRTTERMLAYATMNQAVCATKFFIGTVLGREADAITILALALRCRDGPP